MAWTIEAKILPLVGGISGHLYIEIFDDTGCRVCQINGLATNPVTQQPRSIGLPGDLLKAYVGGGMILGATSGSDRNNHPHEGRVIFQGSEEDILKALTTARATATHLNQLDLPYQLLGLNSNSIFIHMIEALSETIDIDKKSVNEVIRIKKILPGINKKITDQDGKKLKKDFKNAANNNPPKIRKKFPPKSKP